MKVFVGATSFDFRIALTQARAGSPEPWAAEIRRGNFVLDELGQTDARRSSGLPGLRGQGRFSFVEPDFQTGSHGRLVA